tara:strand:+ start:284 stop:1240 length:957 start_codon:yes stop_codon:yes gene_type:complete
MQTVHSNIKDVCVVTWNFTNMCNFACDYCPDELHNGSSGFPDYNNALNFLKRLADKHENIFIELLGGETTMWPKLIPFLKEVKKLANVVVEINTNGSRTNKWWNRYCDADLSMNSFLVFSYHAAFCDPDLFYSNLEIASKDHQVVANFMLDPKHWDKSYNLFTRSKELAIDSLFKVLRLNFHPSKLIDGYTEEMLEIIKSTDQSFKYNRNTHPKASEHLVWPMKIYYNGEQTHWQKLIVESNHKFKGWKCGAGSKRFYINFNGDAFVCSQLMHYDPKKAGKHYLGNLDTDINILDNYITCPKDYCPCKMDAIVDKYLP